MKIDKFDRSEGFKDLSNIIWSQRVGNTSQEKPVVRDRSMLVLVDIESGGDR
jgi:hypothetical protein